MNHRSYTEITRRIENLHGEHLQVEEAGRVEEYPVHHVRVDRDSANARKMLITGGVHGDEPSGVEAALLFLERVAAERVPHFQFSVIPCLNPGGYIRNTRENDKGVDINRSFEEEDVTEVEILKRLMADCQVDCFVDFHEDWESTGFYLYEGRRATPELGPEIISAVETVGPIDPDDPEDEPLSRGVYEVAKSWGTQGLAAYMLEYHARHVLIFESPMQWPLDTKVAAHLQALEVVLHHYENR